MGTHPDHLKNKQAKLKGERLRTQHEGNIKATIQGRPGWQWNRRSELKRRLLAQICEICEATRMTTQIEVHHIQALKDLQKYVGREKPLWVKVMAARRRKTLVLYRTCLISTLF